MCKKEQAKAKRKGSVKPDIACRIALKRVYNIAFRTLYCTQANTLSMAMKEALQLGMGATDTKGCLDTNRQAGMIRADFIPALRWEWPIIPGKIMQSRQEEVEALSAAQQQPRLVSQKFSAATQYQ
jgi:hypothetical protein